MSPNWGNGKMLDCIQSKKKITSFRNILKNTITTKNISNCSIHYSEKPKSCCKDFKPEISPQFAEPLINIYIIPYTLEKKLLYHRGPATINGICWISHIEVPICIFQLINELIKTHTIYQGNQRPQNIRGISHL